MQRAYALAEATGADLIIAFVLWGDNYDDVNVDQEYWAEGSHPTVKLARRGVLALTAVAVAGCGPSPDPSPTVSSSSADETPGSTSPSSRQFRQSGEFSVHTSRWGEVPVYTVAGLPDPTTCRVLIVMHGTNRNPADYRDSWAELVAGRPWVVLVPDFSEAAFPGVENYNLGGTITTDGQLREPEQWSFNVVPEVFRYWQQNRGSQATKFDLFGHSAGAQFVHRFAAFMPQVPVRRAIAANAGWYTMPDDTRDYPYGWRKAPTVDPRGYLGRDLTVLLGANDTGDENLRTSAEANRQGKTRLERGMTFYSTGHALAQSSGWPFTWSLSVVPGAEHDHVAMAKAAAPLLW